MTSGQPPARPLRVLIAGGGTGGHLYPGIALARELLARRPGTVVTFAGTTRGIEARVVPREGFALDVIRSAGFKGVSRAARLRAAALLPLSGLDAWRVLSRRRPDVVVGVGGYSSGPIVLLAAVRRIPTLLIEPNAVPGVTNRALARVVRAAAVAYPSALSHFKGKGFVSGTPVRAEFFAHHRVDGIESGPAPVRVLIVGGSQGAHAINVAAVEAAAQLAAAAVPLAITHQTGDADLDMVRAGYRTAGVDARVEPFLFEMNREMTTADLLVCRAGAMTLAEIAAAGRPAILVPLPGAADDHQLRNAEVLVAAGAARLLEQRQLSGESFASTVLALAADAEARRRMSDAVRTLARPDAASAIADRVIELGDRRAAPAG